MGSCIKQTSRHQADSLGGAAACTGQDVCCCFCKPSTGPYAQHTHSGVEVSLGLSAPAEQQDHKAQLVRNSTATVRWTTTSAALSDSAVRVGMSAKHASCQGVQLQLWTTAPPLIAWLNVEAWEGVTESRRLASLLLLSGCLAW